MKDISAADLENNIPLVASRHEGHATTVRVGPVEFGSSGIVVIAGPCAVETEELMLDIAHAVKRAGAHMLRGGAFKPLTFPYRRGSMMELGEPGLALLQPGRQGSRTARRHRGDGRTRRRRCRRARGHAPDRRSQHVELSAAHRGREGGQASPAQAPLRRQPARLAGRGGVLPLPRQYPGRALRARRGRPAHTRGHVALHRRPAGRARRPRVLPPAGDCRPQSRHLQAQVRRARSPGAPSRSAPTA